MYQPLVSVVIPVYNMENYIERCIMNLRQQTYENLQIIIVDDGSKDRTQEICCLMSKEEQRIKFFSKSNEGVSTARNYALKHATGEYVTFVDADGEEEQPDILDAGTDDAEGVFTVHGIPPSFAENS